MWFNDLFGFEEESPEQVRRDLVLEGTRLRSLVNDRSYGCGTLEVPSLAELRKASSEISTSAGKLTVREVVADVQSLHLPSESRGALFQVASQFNLLEMVHPGITPEMGVGRYGHDRTQGPACAIACGAGTVYRNYFLPVNGQPGQTEERQIDCLQWVGDTLRNDELRLWHMRNGYVMSNEAGLKHIADVLHRMNEAEREHLKGQLGIGVQWDAEVTLPGAGHTVSQAYCSALPVAYSQVEGALWQPFARLVLEAAYEATLHAALINLARSGSPVVYLTLLGGGAFGNPTAWILDAIAQALHKFKHAPLDVRIVSYGDSDPLVKSLVDAWRGHGREARYIQTA